MISKPTILLIPTTPQDLRAAADLLERKSKAVKWGESYLTRSLTQLANRLDVAFCLDQQRSDELKENKDFMNPPDS